jgi:subtilisin family serine protease
LNIFIIIAFTFVLVIGLVFMPTQNQNAEAIPTNGKILPGEFIVTLKPTSDRHVIALADGFNETLQAQGGIVDRVYTRAIDGFSVKGVDDIGPLAFDPAVAKVERNMAMPVDAQFNPTGISRIGLDKAATTAFRPDKRETKTNVDIAVIDAVVHPHPDLNIFRTVSFISGTDPAVQIHGTHVAGICCARDNLGGVVGVAQGARIWSLKVCGGDVGDNLCSFSGVIAAADYVIANKASIEVATMSCCGGGESSTAKNTAISNVIANGVTYTLSMGNTGTECQPTWGCALPTTAIAVSNLRDYDGKCGGLLNSGTNRDDTLSTSSTWGSQADIMAPGTNILSTIPGTAEHNPYSSALPYIGVSEQGAYEWLSGTSMATPYAAGVAGLIKVKNPGWTPAQIKTDMQANGLSQSLACDGASEGGLVQGANAKGSEKLLWAENY